MQWMKTIGIAVLLASMLAGCDDMTRTQRNTAIGAGVGAVTGSVLTNGDALGTLGGAAIGGVIGHGTR
jgi:osmotically inducible lipoprotein OsmB